MVEKAQCPLFHTPGMEREYRVKGMMVLQGLGRISTSTVAGAYLEIDASNYQYGEAVELRYAVVDWSDVSSIGAFTGIYCAVENREDGTGKGVTGAEFQARDNDVGIGTLRGIHVNAYIKGSTGSITIGSAYGIQGQVEFASNVGTRTVTTEVCALWGMVYSAGTITGLTKLHGLMLRFGDQDGQSTTMGSGIRIENDSGTAGTRTLTDGIKIAIGCTDAIEISGSPTYAINISAQVTAGLYYAVNIATQIGAYAHGVKVELTRSANIQPVTGCWFGGQFVLNAGTTAWDDVNTPAYAVHGVIKGDQWDGVQDVQAGRFETQNSGKCTEIVHVLANTGTSCQDLLYLATHINPSDAILCLNVQSSATAAKGIRFTAGSGSTMTSMIAVDGDGTFTNLLNIATGNGILTGVTTHDTESDEIKVLVGSTTKYIKLYT